MSAAPKPWDHLISEEEKKIRQNPVGYGSAILSKVFGAIR